MDLKLNGRRAIVAASSTGLGFATAKCLVDEGALVAICGRDADRINAAAKLLGANAIAIVADAAMVPPTASVGI